MEDAKEEMASLQGQKSVTGAFSYFIYIYIYIIEQEALETDVSPPDKCLTSRDCV